MENTTLALIFNTEAAFNGAYRYTAFQVKRLSDALNDYAAKRGWDFGVICDSQKPMVFIASFGLVEPDCDSLEPDKDFTTEAERAFEYALEAI